jgi:hypothetical protein
MPERARYGVLPHSVFNPKAAWTPFCRRARLRYHSPGLAPVDGAGSWDERFSGWPA